MNYVLGRPIMGTRLADMVIVADLGETLESAQWRRLHPVYTCFADPNPSSSSIREDCWYVTKTCEKRRTDCGEELWREKFSRPIMPCYALEGRGLRQDIIDATVLTSEGTWRHFPAQHSPRHHGPYWRAARFPTRDDALHTLCASTEERSNSVRDEEEREWRLRFPNRTIYVPPHADFAHQTLTSALLERAIRLFFGELQTAEGLLCMYIARIPYFHWGSFYPAKSERWCAEGWLPTGLGVQLRYTNEPSGIGLGPFVVEGEDFPTYDTPADVAQQLKKAAQRMHSKWTHYYT